MLLAIYVPQGSYRISDTLTLGPTTAPIGIQPAETRLVLLPSTVDNTLLAMDSRALVAHPEIAELRVR